MLSFNSSLKVLLFSIGGRRIDISITRGLSIAGSVGAVNRPSRAIPQRFNDFLARCWSPRRSNMATYHAGDSLFRSAPFFPDAQKLRLKNFLSLWQNTK
jgi:hypothetical protein